MSKIGVSPARTTQADAGKLDTAEAGQRTQHRFPVGREVGGANWLDSPAHLEKGGQPGAGVGRKAPLVLL